jgi:hypothetical protein
VGVYAGPDISEDGLVLALDASNTKSYPGSGTTWTDLSGRGNNGTLTTGTVYSSSNGGSIDFDGAQINPNGTLNISNSQSLQNTLSTSSFTITSVSKCTDLVYPKSVFPFWIETYVLNDTFGIANRGMSSGDGSNETGFRIEVNNGGTYFQGTVSHTTVLSTIYHRTMVIDRSNGFKFKYYVNGIFLGEVESASITGSIYSSGGLTFGNMYGWTFKGSLYNLSIHSKALTAAEIQQNYNATKSRYGL